MKKIAVIGVIHQSGLDILINKGYDVIEINDISKNNLKKQLSDVDAIGLRTAPVDREILESCSNLKIISRHGVGYNNVDLDYLNKHNQALAVTGTSNAVSVAEHVMTMFLYLTKNIKKSDALVRAGKFKEQSTLPNFFELYQKKILILGFGRIGQAVAKRCLGFDTQVMVYDPFVDEKIINEKNCLKISFEEGIKSADFITVHMPLSDQTKNLINKKNFLEMKNEAILVNTARGGIVNEADLYWALKNKIIYAAGTDVFELEPPSNDNPLLTLDNILFSPHNAALTLECRKRMSVETAENILYFLENDKKLNKQNIINKDIFDL
jgi:D-3-phosphoglycerate dehydrogenase